MYLFYCDTINEQYERELVFTFRYRIPIRPTGFRGDKESLPVVQEHGAADWLLQAVLSLFQAVIGRVFR